MHILKQLKFNFSKILLLQNIEWASSRIEKQDLNIEKQEKLSPEQEKLNSLKKELDTLISSKKFVSDIEYNLKNRLLKQWDPKDKEFQELAEKIKNYQNEIKWLWEKEASIKNELNSLLQEVKNEMNKLSPIETEKLKTISNREFLETPKSERLQYITKDNIDSESVSSWSVNNLEFSCQHITYNFFIFFFYSHV